MFKTGVPSWPRRRRLEAQAAVIEAVPLPRDLGRRVRNGNAVLRTALSCLRRGCCLKLGIVVFEVAPLSLR
jgi:hypothetical protein